MIETTVHEAKRRLSRFLDAIAEGEEVLIRRHGKPVARLVAAHAPHPSPLGAMAGEFDLPADWNRPLTGEEADAFWAGQW